MNKFGTIFWRYVVSRRRLLYLLVIFLMYRFGLCLSLSRDGNGFPLCDSDARIFTLCILIWDFAMTFQEYRKALLYEEIELASTTGTSPL